VVAWLPGIMLFVACWLLWDAATAFADWQGLRSTPLGRRAVLLAALSLLIVSLVVGRNWLTRPVAGLIPACAGVFHLGLALVAQRRLHPTPWTTAGDWPTHRVTAVDLQAEQGTIPGLIYEPLKTANGAIVLVHGAGAHKSFYTWPMVEAVLEAGYLVCAIDLDGHGDNQRLLDFPSVLEDVTVAVAEMRRRATWVGVIGVSLGGCIAARAVADGLQVDALAIFESPVAVEVTRQVVRNEHRTLLRAGAWGLHRYAGTWPIIRAWATEPTRSRISTVELIAKLDLLTSLARVRCPLFLCYGERDLVVPPAQLWQIGVVAIRAGTPLRVVPRATHLSLPLDRRALADLRQWIESLQG
jgi:pimeloyl-ACP methyl ester carboxylesterase